MQLSYSLKNKIFSPYCFLPYAPLKLIKFVSLETGLISFYRSILVLVFGVYYWEDYQLILFSFLWILLSVLSLMVDFCWAGGVPCLILASLQF